MTLGRRPPSQSTMMSLGFLVLGFTAACGNIHADAKLRYAHASAGRLTGTPIGHLELIKSGISQNFSNGLAVCLQSSGDPATDSYRLFETKLAHAAWLSDAGYNSDAFAKLSFELKDQCSTSDANYMTVVIYGEKSREKSGDNFDKLFSAARMSCTVSADSMSCNSDGGISLGWGGPASIRSFYRADAPQKWTSMERLTPGIVILSPHVSWKPLTHELQSASGASSDEQNNLLEKYNSLVAQKKPRFEDLKSLAESLRSANAKGSQDQEFQRLMMQFAQNRQGVTAYEFKPVISSYHTLLHEIGHTFGMTHADNPGADDITGSSAKTTCDQSNRCTTSEASMAYGEFFNFLTVDDQAGIQSVGKLIQSDIASHR